MRRAVMIAGSTVAGLAALFSYKTHAAGVAVASTAPATPAVSASPAAPANLAGSASPSPSRTAKKVTPKKPVPAKTTPTHPAASPSQQPTTPPPAPAPTKTSAPAKPSGTFTGPSENTQYGPVKVQISVSDGKITNASGSLPEGGDSIGYNALPQLNQEVLTAQSASIQAVSGASYTSQGYIQSLQQAVDQAGL